MEPTRNLAQSRGAPFLAAHCHVTHVVRHASSLSRLPATRPQGEPTLPNQHTGLKSIKIP